MKNNYKHTGNVSMSQNTLAGFTLIEVLVAFAILSTLLMVIIQSYSDTSFFLQRTRLRETAQKVVYTELFKIEREGFDAFMKKSGTFPEEHILAGAKWSMIEKKEKFMDIIPVKKITYRVEWQNGRQLNSFESSILTK